MRCEMPKDRKPDSSIQLSFTLLDGISYFPHVIADQFQLQGAFWNAISGLNDNFGALGYGIVALFIVSWGTSFLVYRFKRYDLYAGLD